MIWAYDTLILGHFRTPPYDLTTHMFFMDSVHGYTCTADEEEANGGTGAAPAVPPGPAPSTAMGCMGLGHWDCTFWSRNQETNGFSLW